MNGSRSGGYMFQEMRVVFFEFEEGFSSPGSSSQTP